jgi:hypothetical protein
VKIFNLSLHRSGTQSFHSFLGSHGFKAAHWPGWTFEELCAEAVDRLDTGAVWMTLKEVLAECDVFCDLPYPVLYQEAFAAYPEAKFLLILRDVRGWMNSVRKHIGNRPLSIYERFQYWSYSSDRPDRLDGYSERDLETIYLSHVASVTRFMREKKASFGIFWLTDPDIGNQCANYFNFKMEGEFPLIDHLRAKIEMTRLDSKAVGQK